MIYSPHKDAEHRVAGAEHLHLLLDEVFLFSLGFSGQHENGAGSAAGVTESRHRAASPLLGSCFPLQLSLTVQSERTHTNPEFLEDYFFGFSFVLNLPAVADKSLK